MIIDHITKLQDTIPQLRGTLFVINVEANLAYASPSAKHDLDVKVGGRFKYVVIEDDKRPEGNSVRMNPTRAIVVTAGTRTNNANKLEMVHAMSTLLNQGRIHFHRHFQNTSDDQSPPPAFADLRAVIERQFRSFRRRYLPLPRGQESVKFRKMQYEGAEDDDFVMALMLTSYSMKRAQEIPSLRSVLLAHHV
jgi:hypothetical protein